VAFKKGTSGNPAGRPKGIKDRRVTLRERLAKEAGAILGTMIAKARAGDIEAGRFLLGRLLPAAKDLPVNVNRPGADLASKGDRIIAAMFRGELAPSEAGELIGALERQAKLIDHVDLAERVAKLEARIRENEP
jgi:hypothetical protein